MSSHHLTDDQLIDRLYGMDQTGDAHLQGCRDCTIRWEMVQERRGRMLVETPVAEVPEGAVLWSKQRRRILEQVEGGAAARNWQRAWVTPVFLTALILAAGVWFYGPVNPPAPAAVAVDYSDPGWFEDTYSVMQPDEPRAAGPIRVLFEQQEEEVTE